MLLQTNKEGCCCLQQGAMSSVTNEDTTAAEANITINASSLSFVDKEIPVEWVPSSLWTMRNAVVQQFTATCLLVPKYVPLACVVLQLFRNCEPALNG
jgi:hypothetical protein